MTARDRAFAETLTDVAIGIDELCDRLTNTQDRRADDIISTLRDVEFECNELSEQVQS